jgi:hypothetical protein
MQMLGIAQLKECCTVAPRHVRGKHPWCRLQGLWAHPISAGMAMSSHKQISCAPALHIAGASALATCPVLPQLCTSHFDEMTPLADGQ